MIGYRTHWYGKEVEGRFTDIETLFISDIKALYEKLEVPAHVYFCSPATEQLIKQDDWMNMFELITDNTFVTIEATPGMVEHIPPMIRIRAHILLMLNCTDAGLLKKTDSIKVVYADYATSYTR
jgi:hypothetical protein